MNSEIKTCQSYDHRRYLTPGGFLELKSRKQQRDSIFLLVRDHHEASPGS